MHTVNSPKATFSVLLVAAAIAAGAAKATPAKGVISSTPASAVDYCHLEFPAIRPSTLGTPNPRLKEAASGDIVDYYGPCDHDPLGKDEVAEQEHENEVRQSRDNGL